MVKRIIQSTAHSIIHFLKPYEYGNIFRGIQGLGNPKRKGRFPHKNHELVRYPAIYFSEMDTLPENTFASPEGNCAKYAARPKRTVSKNLKRLAPMTLEYNIVGSFDGHVMLAIDQANFAVLTAMANGQYQTEQQQREPRLISAEKFAEELEFSTNTVREWCKTILKDVSRNTGNRWLINAEAAKRILISNGETSEKENAEEPTTAGIEPRKTGTGMKKRARVTKPIKRAAS